MFSNEATAPLAERDPEIVEKVEAALDKEDKNIHIDSLGRTYGTGRRKTSVARVWLKPGSGLCVVNGKSFVEYFQPQQLIFALGPFNATSTSCLYDVLCTVKGGGISGQAGAVRLGISRALEKHQSELRPPLRKGGYLTRDPRMVERKKPGQKKARKQYQWVKR
jgi:small subunit ribosomal protein S9